MKLNVLDEMNAVGNRIIDGVIGAAKILESVIGACVAQAKADELSYQEAAVTTLAMLLALEDYGLKGSTLWIFWKDLLGQPDGKTFVNFIDNCEEDKLQELAALAKEIRFGLKPRQNLELLKADAKQLLVKTIREATEEEI